MNPPMPAPASTHPAGADAQAKKLSLGAVLLGFLLILAALILAACFGFVEYVTTGAVVVTAGIWLILYLAATIVAVVEAIALVRHQNSACLARSMKIVKLCSVPFFVLNYLYILGLTIGLSVIGLAFASPVGLGLSIAAIPFLVAGTYLVFLPTSIYGLSAIVVAKRRGAVGWQFVITHVIGQLGFVLDMISTPFVAHVSRARRSFAGPMLRWLAALVVATLVGPAAVVSADALGRDHDRRVSDHVQDLPGVIRYEDPTVEVKSTVTNQQVTEIYTYIVDHDFPTRTEIGSGQTTLQLNDVSQLARRRRSSCSLSSHMHVLR